MFNTMRRRNLGGAGRPARVRGKDGVSDAGKVAPVLKASERNQSLLLHPIITLYTGLRNSSALNLHDCNGDVSSVRVLGIGHDKAGKREQPVPQILADYLGEMIKGMGADHYLFA